MILRLAIIALFLGSAIAEANPALESRFSRDVLIIEAGQHACYVFDIYVAITDEQRSRGLMFVRELPQTTGMLFVYNGDHPVSMWMKNTFIPLDMVFARADGSVSSIIRNTEPQSLKSLASTEAVMFVLELNAGTADRLGIDERSRLIWEPMHGNDE